MTKPFDVEAKKKELEETTAKWIYERFLRLSGALSWEELPEYAKQYGRLLATEFINTIAPIVGIVDWEAERPKENDVADYITSFPSLKEPLDCLILAHELLDKFWGVGWRPAQRID